MKIWKNTPVARLIPSLALALACSLTSAAHAQELLLKSGDRVAVIGDSITEQKAYSRFIEDYLLMCKPAENLRVTQMGWGGETARGFAARMENDALCFHPTVVTTCFGMNDSAYSAQNPTKAKGYFDAQSQIVERFKKAAVRAIIVGSPGVVDIDAYRGGPQASRVVNETLASLRDIARDVAKSQGVYFADVHEPMMKAMLGLKAEMGPAYHVAGVDGIHPSENGHLAMAYAFLKAMGCCGDIGTLTLDLPSGQAQASDGHKILSAAKGTLQVESHRYPFCFYGTPKNPLATIDMVRFIPFNQELNRLMLVVKGAAPTASYKVTWGKVSKTFHGEELARGINLAAEFLDNPFVGAFRNVDGAVARQQFEEVALIKGMLHSIPTFKALCPADNASYDRAAVALVKRDQELQDASAAAVVPVTHTLSVEVLP